MPLNSLVYSVNEHKVICELTLGDTVSRGVGGGGGGVTRLTDGLPDSQIVNLQRVQNTCARLICNLPKFAHVTPLLTLLHWLPIRQRIEFKMLMIVYC